MAQLNDSEIISLSLTFACIRIAENGFTDKLIV